MFQRLKSLFQRIGSQSKASHSEKQSRTYTIRNGEFVKTDEVFDAWTSQDLDKMKQALHTKTNPVDRHFLLMGIVDQTYKQRQDNDGARQLCAAVAEQHIEEFPKIKPALVKSLDGILPRVTTFQKYATLLTEQGDFQRAIEICETALSHGLRDGTKSDFEGRINRIKKKAKAANA